VPDSVWSSKVNGVSQPSLYSRKIYLRCFQHLLTHKEVVELVIRVIDDCDIVNTNGAHPDYLFPYSLLIQSFRRNHIFSQVIQQGMCKRTLKADNSEVVVAG
jgi:hypothetical protein